MTRLNVDRKRKLESDSSDETESDQTMTSGKEKSGDKGAETLETLYSQFGIPAIMKSRRTIAKLSDVKNASVNQDLILYEHPLFDSLYDTSIRHPVITSEFMKPELFEKPSGKRNGMKRNFTKIGKLSHMLLLEDGGVNRQKFPSQEIHQGHSIGKANFSCSVLFMNELTTTPNLICQDAINNTGIDNFADFFKRCYVLKNCPNGAHVLNCIGFDPSSPNLHIVSKNGHQIPRYLSTSLCHENFDGTFTCFTILMENKGYKSKELPKLIVDLEVVEEFMQCTLFGGVDRSKIIQLKGDDISPLCTKAIKLKILQVYGLSPNQLVFPDSDFVCPICHQESEYARMIDGRLVCLDDACFFDDEKRFRTELESTEFIASCKASKYLFIAGDETCIGCEEPFEDSKSIYRMKSEDRSPICSACRGRLEDGIGKGKDRIVFDEHSLDSGELTSIHIGNLPQLQASYVSYPKRVFIKFTGDETCIGCEEPFENSKSIYRMKSDDHSPICNACRGRLEDGIGKGEDRIVFDEHSLVSVLADNYFKDSGELTSIHIGNLPQLQASYVSYPKRVLTKITGDETCIGCEEPFEDSKDIRRMKSEDRSPICTACLYRLENGIGKGKDRIVFDEHSLDSGELTSIHIGNLPRLQASYVSYPNFRQAKKKMRKFQPLRAKLPRACKKN